METAKLDEIRDLEGNPARGIIPVMSNKEQAILAIEKLPEPTSMTDILRELSFLAGVERARAEIESGQGLDAEEAKRLLRKCLSE